jgi:hypothetical protein
VEDDMKTISMILAFLSLNCNLSGEGISGDVTSNDSATIVPRRGPAPLVDGGAAGTDVEVKADLALLDLVAMDVRVAIIVDALADARDGYTDRGVTANLGVNLCAGYYAARGEIAGWLPVAGANGTCYVQEGVCGDRPACGTYAPGALEVWNATDARYRYLGDPSGGYVCLPNDRPYVVLC